MKTLCRFCKCEVIFSPSMKRQFCSRTCYFSWRRADGEYNSLKKATEANIIHPDLKPSSPLFYVVGALKGDGWTSYECRPGHGTAWKLKLCAGLSEYFANSFSQALSAIGLRPHVHLQSARNKSAIWIVTANSKVFVEWYRSLDDDDIGYNLEDKELAAAFLRGMYEAEGTLWTHRGYARCQISNTNPELVMLCLRAFDVLGVDYHIYDDKRAKPRNHIYILNIAPTIEAAHFLSFVKPCIKNVLPLPRTKRNSFMKEFTLENIHRR